MDLSDIWAKWLKLHNAGKLFLLVLFVQTIALTAFNIAPAFDNDNPKQQFFSITLMLSLIFLDYFGIDGILRENTIQNIACMSLETLVVFYGVFYVVKIDDYNREIKIAQMICVIIFFITICIVGWKVYLEFGWRIYRKIGADPHMRAMYRIYQIFLTVVKMDLAMAVILVLMSGVFFIHYTDYELYVNIVMIGVTTYWAVLGYQSIREENYLKAYLFYGFSPVEPIYIIYKAWRFANPEVDGEFDDTPTELLIFAGSVGIVLRIGLMSVYTLAFRNFKKGLADQLKQITTNGVEKVERRLTNL